MSDPIEEKAAFPKCADAIEFGSSFGKFSRVNNKQFVVLLNERTNEEGLVYKIKNKNPSKKAFLVRILRPKNEGILLALWKTGKISLRSMNSSINETIVELKRK
jgi:hypothetical protein